MDHTDYLILVDIRDQIHHQKEKIRDWFNLIRKLNIDIFFNNLINKKKKWQLNKII